MPNHALSRRVASGVIVAAVLSALLAGCVGIPSSGGVNQGPLVSSAGGGGQGVDLPQGPPAGASKTEIFADFLQALNSSAGNYGIAQKFLTTKAAQAWDPTKSVLIRDKPSSPEDIGNDSVSYSVSTNASVNVLGVYSQQATDSNETLDYTFTKVKGQWRISELPDGIVLSTNSFENTFGEYPIYFFDPDFKYLVPDVRWFPTGATVPNRIVSALIHGPSDWLQQGVVSTAFPAGVSVGSPVVVKNNTAVVDFSAEAASTKALARARMFQQVQQSLQGDDLSNIAMTAHGAPIAVSPQLSQAAPAVARDPAPLLEKGKQFGFYPGLASLGPISTQIQQLGATAIVLDHAQTTAAVLAKGEVYRVTESGKPTVVDSRAGLIAPSIDPSGYVWSVPRSNAAAIIAVGADGAMHTITSTIPSRSTIVSMDVSRDGTRLLLYLQTPAGPSLVVAGIVRRDGVPSALAQQMLSLPVTTDQPIDATWVDPSTVAALSSAGGEDTVVSYVIGGSPSDESTTENGVHLVGVGAADSLRLITSSGQIQQLRATGWQDLTVTASVLATQQ